MNWPTVISSSRGKLIVTSSLWCIDDDDDDDGSICMRRDPCCNVRTLNSAMDFQTREREVSLLAMSHKKGVHY